MHDYHIASISSNTIDPNYNTAASNIYTITTTDNTNPYIYSPNIWTTITFPQHTNLEGDFYPKLPNALGVIYVEGGKIKCRTPEGEDIILGEMGDGDEKVTINIIATIAKRLLEKEKIEA